MNIFTPGGFDESSPLDSVERFDPATNTWMPVPRMMSARGGVGVATLAGQIYAAGGHDGNNYLSSVETYSPLTNRSVHVLHLPELCGDLQSSH